MPPEKIEPRLLQEIDRLERAGQKQNQIPVLIELASIASPDQGSLGSLEQRVQSAQQNVRKKLADLGAERTMRPLTLANAIEAPLTPAAIREIAALPEVTLIRWNRAERVTA